MQVPLPMSMPMSMPTPTPDTNANVGASARAAFQVHGRANLDANVNATHNDNAKVNLNVNARAVRARAQRNHLLCFINVRMFLLPLGSSVGEVRRVALLHRRGLQPLFSVVGGRRDGAAAGLISMQMRVPCATSFICLLM